MRGKKTGQMNGGKKTGPGGVNEFDKSSTARTGRLGHAAQVYSMYVCLLADSWIEAAPCRYEQTQQENAMRLIGN